MQTSASRPISAIKIPYRYQYRSYPAPKDDWGYYEGRPTPPLSPLMPYNTVPWWNRRWQFDKIQVPLYSSNSPIGRFNFFRRPFVSSTPINNPTLVKDFHLISIRKQIEQLFSPMFGAHLIVTVSDTMNHPPCFWLRHGRFQRSWWIGDETGGEMLHYGHEHFMREGNPTGSLSVHMELSIANSSYKTWGGSIGGIEKNKDFRSSYGNYYILNIRYEWEVQEFWRKMVLEDWSVIREDYQSIAPNFLMPHFGGWKMIKQTGTFPTGRAIAFAIDCGQMWQPENHPDGFTYPEGQKSYYLGSDGINRVTKYLQSPNTWAYTGPVYSSCSRPYKEGRLDKNSGGGSTKLAGATQISNPVFKNIEGFNCGILPNGELQEISPLDSPEFPSNLTRPGKIFRKVGSSWIEGPIYDTSDNKFSSANGSAVIEYKKVNSQDLEITPMETTINKTVGGASYRHVAHCKGAKFTPKCYVTIMDLCGRIFKDIPVSEVELYFN